MTNSGLVEELVTGSLSPCFRKSRIAPFWNLKCWHFAPIGKGKRLLPSRDWLILRLIVTGEHLKIAATSGRVSNSIWLISLRIMKKTRFGHCCPFVISPGREKIMSRGEECPCFSGTIKFSEQERTWIPVNSCSSLRQDFRLSAPDCSWQNFVWFLHVRERSCLLRACVWTDLFSKFPSFWLCLQGIALLTKLKLLLR